jgi:hypothetical protein
MTKQPNQQQQQGQQGQNRQQGQAGQKGQARQQGMGNLAEGTRQHQQFEADAGDRITAQIREHMEVIGSDGTRIGKVDSVDGERIKLARADWPGDSAPGAAHHFLEISQVQAIEGDAVRLAITADQATQQATRA